MGIEFRVLGPLEIRCDDAIVKASSPKQRLLLTLLLVRPNQAVSTDALVDGLWGGSPPASAVGLVQTYVSQLRKLLEVPSTGPGSPGALVRAHTGYRLVVDPARFDVDRFEALVTDGRRAFLDQQPSDAFESLDRAMALWRGSPFGEFGSEPAVQPAAERLTELHGLALEDRTDAAIQLGRHAELIGELEARVSDDPLRERTWGQLMLCLYRSGRQADALGAYQRLRRNLAEDLGLEPSTALQTLETSILQHQPSLDWPSPIDRVAIGAARVAADYGVAIPGKSRADPPIGTVTFLFTDVEESTRRWQADADAMRSALAAHDELLQTCVIAHGGWLFKHTGDGVCAAFASPSAAIAAAVEAQGRLRLPVRMGIASGEAELRGDDYFGLTLGRAARVTDSAHGGQILVAAATAALVPRDGLVDLGEYRLKGLRDSERIFQVQADGLASAFPPLRTAKATPGNLPPHLPHLVGRQRHLSEVVEAVRSRRFVTLTGVGGVGKTSLALVVAAELASQFPDGVWLVELAVSTDPAAVPALVASALGVTAAADDTLTDRIVQALSERRVLLVLDNCEHLLSAAAELVETLLARTAVTVLATSRENLQTAEEHLWPVPSLDVSAGTSSAAVELFMQRARAVLPDFELRNDDDAQAVVEICRRLDGMALAIELAAARLFSLSLKDVRDRLDDRLRFLRNSGRGPDRHQTLRHVVEWSVALLNADERALLARLAVFSDGFDLDAAWQVCRNPTDVSGPDSVVDELGMLDSLDSLARKSLITVDRSSEPVRYGMLETIRQFAGDELVATSRGDDVRRRHTAYFADRAYNCWSIWDGPALRDALHWLEPNIANLRSAFRWALDHEDILHATEIAAHTALVIFTNQQTEPISWAEEALPAATAHDLPHLPRLLVAASLCSYTGRATEALVYSQRALDLEADPHYDPFEPGLAASAHANAHLFAGHPDQWLAICSDLAERSGSAQRIGLAGLLNGLPAIGRGEQARARADETLDIVREQGNPFWISYALLGYARAFIEVDPALSLHVLREGIAYTAESGLPFWRAVLSRELASIEAIYGDETEALAQFDDAIQSQQRANNVAHVVAILGSLAVFFNRIGEPVVAATIFGSTTPYGGLGRVRGLRDACQQIQAALGETEFEDCVGRGSALTLSEAVLHAQDQIHLARGRQSSK